LGLERLLGGLKALREVIREKPFGLFLLGWKLGGWGKRPDLAFSRLRGLEGFGIGWLLRRKQFKKVKLGEWEAWVGLLTLGEEPNFPNREFN